MTVVEMSKYKPTLSSGVPTRISFYGAACGNDSMAINGLVVNVIIEDGNVLGVLEEVKTTGGIWGQRR